MPNKNLSANELIEQIVEAIQEKKGRNIVVADLKGLGSSVCDYFVICEGNTNTQVSNNQQNSEAGKQKKTLEELFNEDNK